MVDTHQLVNKSPRKRWHGPFGWPNTCTTLTVLVATTGLLSGCTRPAEDSSVHASALKDTSSPAPLDAYPWIVSLQRADGSHLCAGSAIAPDLVLTAAHCIGTGEPLTIAVLGARDLTAGGGRRFKLGSEASAYNFANAEAGQTDVAVVRVEGEIVEGELVAGVGMPPPYARLPYHFESNMPSESEAEPGTDSSVAGWNTARNQLLHYAFGEPNSQLEPDCRGYTCGTGEPCFSALHHSMCHDRNLIIEGDSGGPLVAMSRISDEHVLLGVVSLSEGEYDAYADLVGYERSPQYMNHGFWSVLREPQSPKVPGEWVQVGTCVTDLSDENGFTAESWYETIQTADIDGDGDIDLLARRSDGLHLFEQTTPFTFSARGAAVGLTDSLGYSSRWLYQSITTADLDDDGRDDIIAFLPDGEVGIHWATGGSPGYAWSPTEVLPEAADLPSLGRHLRVADLDGDGRRDLVAATIPTLATPGEFKFVVFLNRSSGPGDLSFEVHHTEFTDTWATGKALLFADLVLPAPSLHPFGNGDEMVIVGGGSALGSPQHPDGFLDVYSWDGESFSNLLYDEPRGEFIGSSTPQHAPLECDDGTFLDPSEEAFTSTLRAGNFSGAPCEDLLIRCPSGARVLQPTCVGEYDTGIRERGFSSPMPLRPTTPYYGVQIPDGWTTPSSFRTLAVGDVDGDGDDDFVARSPSGLLTYLNMLPGSLSFQPASPYSPPWTDVAGWDALSRASTIRLVRMNTSPRAHLLARDACGMVVYEFRL